MNAILSIVTLLFVLPVSAGEICECFGPMIDGHPNYVGTMPKEQCLAQGDEVGKCWAAADTQKAFLETIIQKASARYCSCYSYRFRNNVCTAQVDFQVEAEGNISCHSICGATELYESVQSAIEACRTQNL